MAEQAINQLLKVMAQLRDPRGGCPWDLEQDFSSIAPYTIEEAYEVADAINRNNLDDLREELGDLLLQVVFHAQMAAENGDFDFDDVASGIVQKMIRRHPHVFGDEIYETPSAVKSRWDEIKAQEKASKGNSTMSLLDEIPRSFPGLMQAAKLQHNAAKVGFDWPDATPVFDKVEEELVEVRDAYKQADQQDIEGEIGDLLFSCVNLARHLKVDPDSALRRTNEKFRVRFMAMESTSDSELKDLSTDELEQLWQDAK